MTPDNEFNAAVSELAETAAYYIELAVWYGLAREGDHPLDSWAHTVVRDLTSGDERLAAEAAKTVVEWFNTKSDEWWSSPLGRLVEAETAPQGDEGATVTTGQAASLLDVSYSRLNHFIQERRIQRFSKGMLSRADVGALLAERAAE
jgi:hypothetical protein